MSTVSAEVSTMDIGQLANRGMAVKALQAALGRAETNLDVIPRLMSRVIREEAWRHWLDGDNGEFKAADFRLFLTTPRPAGCGTPLHVIERALQGTDAWEPYLEAIRGERGGPNNPAGSNQYTVVNRDTITVDQPTIIRLPTRDPSREAPTGTSVSYAVRRLKNNRPDLYERVKAGELTPNRAMVEAGFRPQSITIPNDPQAAARRLLRHFEGERLAALMRALSEGI